MALLQRYICQIGCDAETMMGCESSRMAILHCPQKRLGLIGRTRPKPVPRLIDVAVNVAGRIVSL
jgi:hypothetical protein